MSRLKEVYEKGILESSYSYNNAGRISKIEYANNTSENYTYNKANWITKLENKSEIYSSKVIGSYEYSYYADGNQATSTNRHLISDDKGYTTETKEYKYDTLGKLIEEKSDNKNITSYEYDRFGNRIKAIEKGMYTTETTTYEYSNTNRLIKSIKRGWDNKEEVTKYEYDLNGNQIQKVTENIAIEFMYPTNAETNANLEANSYDIYDIYEYDGFNRMTKSITGRKMYYHIKDYKPPTPPVDPKDPPSTSRIGTEIEIEFTPIPVPKPKIFINTEEGEIQKYSYKPDGLRNTVEGKDNTTIHIWDGENISGEINSKQGNTSYIRGYDLIMSSDKDGNIRYYQHNGQRDTSILTDAQGTVTKTYSYDAFGNEKNISKNDTNPFRYRGEYYDKVTETYYLRARYYKPRTSRMLSPDSYWHPGNRVYGDNPRKMGNKMFPNIYAIMQSSNLYVYVLNNPLRWIDPSGYIIELSSDATKAQKKAYERAIAYLQTSESGAALIKILMDSTETFIIKFNTPSENAYLVNQKVINWDYIRGAVLGDGKSVISPALLLAHEMGHAAQDLAGVYKLYDLNELEQVLALEEANLSNYEIPIAKELGEYTRDYYLDTHDIRRVESSTDWGYLAKKKFNLFNPWTWFGKRFINENPWKP